MIQSRSPSSALARPRKSTRRLVADTVDAGSEAADAAAGPRRLVFPQRPLDLGEARRAKRLGVEGPLAREQLVEEHPERVDVRAGVDVEVRHLRLLGAHVLRRANELTEFGEDAALGEPLRRGLGDAEIDDLRRVLLVLGRHQHVRRLDVPMDDPLLMRMLYARADIDEQRQPFPDAEPLLVAVLGDWDPLHILHREVGTALRRGPRIEHARDVRVVHQRQRLAFRLEARNDFPRVHPGLDHLERHLTADRLLLLRQPHLAHPALTDQAQQAIGSDLDRRRGARGRQPGRLRFGRRNGIPGRRRAH